MPASTSIYFIVDGVSAFTRTIPYDINLLLGKDKSDLIKLAAAKSWEQFIQTRLPKRFDGFAIGELGYSVNPKTWVRKKQFARDYNPEAIKPNVMTGVTKRAVLNGTKVVTSTVRKTSGEQVKARLVFSGIPGYINQQGGTGDGVTMRTLKKVTGAEATYLAERFFTEMMNMMQTVQPRHTPNRAGTKIVTRNAVAPQYAAQFGRTNRATSVSTRGSGVANAI